MRPDDDDLDEEIRGHLAISIKERLERGEDPASARLAALQEIGNVTLTRDPMRRGAGPRLLPAPPGRWGSPPGSPPPRRRRQRPSPHPPPPPPPAIPPP